MTEREYETFTGPVPPSDLPTFIRTKLGPLLPYSLPLYRRCQFFLGRELAPASARSATRGGGRPAEPEVWVAVSTLSPSTRDTSVGVSVSVSVSVDGDDRLATWLRSPLRRPEPGPGGEEEEEGKEKEIWLAAYLDLREPGQTQVWFFGSWEAVWSSSLSAGSDERDGVTASMPTPSLAHIALAQRLFHRLRTHHVPTLSSEPTPQYLTMKAAGKLMSTPYRRSKVLFGTLAEASRWIVGDEVVSGYASASPSSSSSSSVNSTTRSSGATESGAGLDSSTQTKNEGKKNTFVTRADMSYLKYLLQPPLPSSGVPAPSTQSQAQPPSSFRTGQLRTEHLQTMLDRTKIPRTLETLRSLVSVGLFPSDEEHPSRSPSNPDPVAWGILGKDASISSLHTEEEYRGRRLAERVVRELMSLQAGVFTSSPLAGSAEEIDGENVSWAHTDVSVTNLPSRRVFEKMGARIGWRVSWIEVEVEVEGGEGR